MKYVSIDIETTGLDPELDQILSIGLVIEDTNNIKPLEELPALHIIIPRDRIYGDTFAINMNKNIIEHINNYNIDKNYKIEGVEFVYEENVMIKIANFFKQNGLNMDEGINVAGKNFSGFDNLFIQLLPDYDKYFKFSRRVLDPAILFVDFKEDKKLPDLLTCKKIAGINGEVTHNALEDALDVISTLRTKY